MGISTIVSSLSYVLYTHSVTILWAATGAVLYCFHVALFVWLHVMDIYYILAEAQPTFSELPLHTVNYNSHDGNVNGVVYGVVFQQCC